MTAIAQIRKRNGDIVPFQESKITEAIYRAAYSQGGHDRRRAEQLKDEVVALLRAKLGPDEIPQVEQVQDLIEKVLIENGHARTAKAFILYRNERARLRAQKRRLPPFDVEPIPYKKLWQILNWNVEHGCETVEKLNQRIREGSFPDLVLEADAAYDADIDQAAQQILQRAGEVRLVIIAGPSSSGKTTSTIKISQRLEAVGLRFVAMNLDNYFFDLEVHPRDEYGDYDFETPAALDLELINEHLAALLAGERIMMPKFDFQTGRRSDERIPLQLEENEIILIDSLHGLYEPMTSSVPASAKCKLYIETLTQLKTADGEFVRWTDTRLLRRMIRDMHHRNHTPRRTLEHWHYVRGSELKHIIPYMHTADYIINGALAYELPVLKHFLFPYFQEFLRIYAGEEERRDAHDRARRVHDLLDAIDEVSDHSLYTSPSTRDP